MKKILSAILIFVFVSLSACAGEFESKSFGDEITNDTLRICVDCRTTSSQYSSDLSAKEAEVKQCFEGLVEDIKDACDIEQVAFEVLPIEGSERKTALQRLRTEIMAGSGPDVFIMNGASGSLEFGYDDALFNFPEKNMEMGLFLPLDEYMENNTQFTDWSNQTGTIMAAGRNDEGQVIVPMTYTFPVLVYPKNEVSMDY